MVRSICDVFPTLTNQIHPLHDPEETQNIEKFIKSASASDGSCSRSMFHPEELLHAMQKNGQVCNYSLKERGRISET